MQSLPNNNTPSELLGGRYRLLRPIGQGGMSTVFLAEDMKLPGKLWAVKQYNNLGTEYSIAQGEVAVMLQLKHPYLPHIVDFFPPNPSNPDPPHPANPQLPQQLERSDYGYLVMEYIEGQTLLDWLSQQGNRLPIRLTLEIGMQVCELLQYLHEQQPAPIVYRDLKPANLMLDKQGKIRLIDFGIARSYKPGQSSDTVPLGTMAFAAPEQLNREQTDPRSDLYSLGAMLYFLLSGGSYFVSTRKPLHQLRDELDEQVSEVVHRLMEHDPGDRFQTAGDAGAALYQVSLPATLDPLHSTISKGITARTEQLPLTLPDTSSNRVGQMSASHATYTAKGQKLIIVGSLYAGAGATFTTIALARTLARLSIPAAVIESAVREPELAALLRLPDVRPTAASANYYDDDPSLIGHTKGGIRWLALQPSAMISASTDSRSAAANVERVWQAMERVTESNVILDVSDGWLDQGVLQLCRTTAETEIVVVLDPFPSRWEAGWTHRNLQVLRRLSNEGHSIRWVMNKDAPHAGRKERMNRAPAKPLCVLPYIAAEQRLQALDKGKLVQDMPVVRESIATALMPLLKQLQLLPASSKTSSTFSFLSFF